MQSKKDPAPIRALHDGSIVDERPVAPIPAPRLRSYALAFLAGLMLGASIACAYFWWRLESIAEDAAPSWSKPTHYGDE